MPKAAYRAYHVERAKAGVALTMTAGSATVSRDSAPAFNNILAYKDEVVGWMKDLADACHEHGAAVMIQLTHLGRRTRWDRADWLPVVSPSHHREAAHRAFPKKLEEWDIERIVEDYADAAERMQAAGLDGIELEAYGHLMDQFWSPLTNTLDGPYGGSLDNRLRFAFEVLAAIRERVGAEFILGVRLVADEAAGGRPDAEDGLEISRRLKAAAWWTSSMSCAAISTPTPASPTSSPCRAWPARRISISPARCAPRRRCRPFTPPGSPTSRRRVMRSPPANSTWSA